MAVSNKTPKRVKEWVNSRFTPLEEREDVAFDLVRASVNLVLGGLLIAVGTSFKLPLSTTYVTFMVAMGTSLADRAWGRESAVYRVTGVISVIGGWFITAGAAFVLAVTVAAVMHFGGLTAMFIMIALVIYMLYRSRVNYEKKAKAESEDKTKLAVLNNENPAEVWYALKSRSAETLASSLSFSAVTYRTLFESFAKDFLRPVKGIVSKIPDNKAQLKKNRRFETKGLQRIDQELAFERSTWYHLCTNSCQQMLNTLSRIAEPIKEHMEHSFSPLSQANIEEFSPYCLKIYNVLEDMENMISANDFTNASEVSERAKVLKHSLAALRKELTMRLHLGDGSLRVDFVYLNLVQESHELLSEARNLLRGCGKFFE